MKKLIYILSITLLFTSCEDVVEVDVPDGEPRLVVDVSFEFYLNEDPIDIEGYLRLTLSAPFFDENVTPVSDATVFITNLEDGTIINFQESTSDDYDFLNIQKVYRG